MIRPIKKGFLGTTLVALSLSRMKWLEIFANQIRAKETGWISRKTTCIQSTQNNLSIVQNGKNLNVLVAPTRANGCTTRWTMFGLRRISNTCTEHLVECLFTLIQVLVAILKVWPDISIRTGFAKNAHYEGNSKESVELSVSKSWQKTCCRYRKTTLVMSSFCLEQKASGVIGYVTK